MIYLYVKQHTKTKLKYFGKTTRDPHRYRGSGSYWKKHIRKHGIEHIETIDLWTFNDQKECTQFAITFSETNNIVQSDEWANLIIEDGLGGRGVPGHIQSVETKKKRSIAMSGKTKSKSHKLNLSGPRPNSRVPKSESHKQNMKKPKSESHKQNMKGRIWITDGVESKIIYPSEQYLYPTFKRGRIRPY